MPIFSETAASILATHCGTGRARGMEAMRLLNVYQPMGFCGGVRIHSRPLALGGVSAIPVNDCAFVSICVIGLYSVAIGRLRYGAVPICQMCTANERKIRRERERENKRLCPF